MAFESKLRLRNLEISPPLALAPMVGLSHSALRSLIVELGGVGLLFSEMLSAKRLPDENENVSPLLIRSSAEQPLFYQVFLNDAQFVKPAVDKIHTLHAQGIDLNLGCPAPQLRKSGAGCALTNNHRNVREILAVLRKATPLPLSVKIRLGKSDNRNKFVELCKIIEDEGVDAVTIHARLDEEKFCRPPRWQCIAVAKENISIPVIANGGIFSVDDARRCLEISGADGLMVGRGAAVKPWLFTQINQSLFGTSKKSDIIPLREIYARFIALLVLRFSQERRLGRLKQFTHYFAQSYPFGHRLASAVQNSNTMEQAIFCSEKFFDTNEPLTI